MNNNDVPRLVIIGSGGHARAVIDILQQLNTWNLQCVIDLEFSGQTESIMGIEVCGLPEKWSFDNAFLSIGDNNKRHEMFQYVRNKKVNIPSLISPLAYVASSAKLGSGVFVAPYAYIGPKTTISDNVIINTSAIVEHESEIGESCHLAPHSTVAGRCNIGERVFLGMGACMLPGVNIVSDVTIGANSTATKNITEAGIYMGSPLRKSK